MSYAHNHFVEHVEYRTNTGLVIPFIVVAVAAVALDAYSLITGQLTGTNAWVIGGLLGLLALGLFCLGVLLLTIPRLSFDSEGVSLQNIGTPLIRIRWDQITGITIQDVRGKGGTGYRIDVKMVDMPAYLATVSARTKSFIESDASWVTGSVMLNTSNIQIDREDLEQEFSARISGSVKRLESIVPDPMPGQSASIPRPAGPVQHAGPATPNPDASHASQDLSMGLDQPEGAKIAVPMDRAPITYRADSGTQALFILGAAALFACGIFGLAAHANLSMPASQARVVLILIILMGLICLAVAGFRATILRLVLEHEGLVYRCSWPPEYRLRWEQVSGVHISGTKSGMSQGTIVVVELKDFEGFTQSLSSAQRYQFLSNSDVYGKGLAIFSAALSASPSTIASQILHHAGLNHDNLPHGR